MDVEVLHEPDRKRFVARVAKRESQLVYRRLEGPVVDFLSTWVHPDVRGQGVADKLVRTALDWARGEGLQVIPSCWYVNTVVRRHPEYGPLIRR